MRRTDDWPMVQTAVDDFRAATDDEVEYCEHCERAVIRGSLVEHCGVPCCADCLFYCSLCGEPVPNRGAVCQCISSPP